MDNAKLNGLIDWCRQKIAELKKKCRSGHIAFDYMSGYEDAMLLVMSKLHGEKNNPKVSAMEEIELINKVQKELEAAKACIYKVSDALDQGSDNDWAREAIEEWTAKYDRC